MDEFTNSVSCLDSCVSHSVNSRILITFEHGSVLGPVSSYMLWYYFWRGFVGLRSARLMVVTNGWNVAASKHLLVNPVIGREYDVARQLRTVVVFTLGAFPSGSTHYVACRRLEMSSVLQTFATF